MCEGLVCQPGTIQAPRLEPTSDKDGVTLNTSGHKAVVCPNALFCTTLISFGVSMEIKMSTLIYWAIFPCVPVSRYQRFGGAHCLHLQSWISMLGNTKYVSVYERNQTRRLAEHSEVMGRGQAEVSAVGGATRFHNPRHQNSYFSNNCRLDVSGRNVHLTGHNTCIWGAPPTSAYCKLWCSYLRAHEPLWRRAT